MPHAVFAASALRSLPAEGPRRERWRSAALGVALALVAGCRGSTMPTGALSDGATSDAPDDAPFDDSGSALGADLPPMLPVAAAPPEPAPPPPPEEAGSCPSSLDDATGLVVSPMHAVAGAPVRVLASNMIATEPLAMRFETTKGEQVAVDLVHRGGVPAMTVGRFVPKRAGDVRVIVGRHGKSLRCVTFRVYAQPAPKKPRDAHDDTVWPVTRAWNRGEEALFSGWIREMFHAARGEELSFGRLDEVTANPERNVLFDHLGWEEDSSRKKGLKLKPDCADMPYFLRAYFAWKRGLPFAYRHCSSGDESRPPRCQEPKSVLQPPDPPSKLPEEWNELAQVQRYFQRAVGEVHSGNGRIPFNDDESDFYGLKLSRRALRPGTVYADPYGHVLLLLEFVEPEGSLPGVLYAVDGQPDGSITRKRFWEGNFLWNPDPALGGSGFKAFRPLVMKHEDGGQIIENLTDAQIAKSAEYGDVSHVQARLDAQKFYDTMDRLITPTARDPFRAQEEMVRALSEAAKVRVTSVNNAEPYFAEHPDAVIPMPEGAEIFETSGPWEDFSTPSRDLRLLIAMDVVRRFDEKVARQPDAFGTQPGGPLDDLRRRLAAERKRLFESDELAFSYKRSDGTPRKLTLADLVTRAAAFEVTYNPNDCAELRWGAEAGTDELSTCKRHAPEDQRQRMEAYRTWFRERKRPPRGT